MIYHVNFWGASAYWIIVFAVNREYMCTSVDASWPIDLHSDLWPELLKHQTDKWPLDQGHGLSGLLHSRHKLIHSGESKTSGTIEKDSWFATCSGAHSGVLMKQQSQLRFALESNMRLYSLLHEADNWKSPVIQFLALWLLYCGFRRLIHHLLNFVVCERVTFIA